MSKWTPEEVLRHPQQVADEIAKLETDRAELAELLLTAVNSGKVSGEWLADAQALLARLEAE